MANELRQKLLQRLQSILECEWYRFGKLKIRSIIFYWEHLKWRYHVATISDCMFCRFDPGVLLVTARTCRKRRVPVSECDREYLRCRDWIPRELQMLYEMAIELRQKLLRRLQSILECKWYRFGKLKIRSIIFYREHLKWRYHVATISDCMFCRLDPGVLLETARTCIKKSVPASKCDGEYLRYCNWIPREL